MCPSAGADYDRLVSDDRKEADSMQAATSEIRNHANLIWAIAELLRGDYKQADYGKVILPLVVIPPRDQPLVSTKDFVLQEAERLRAHGVSTLEPVLVQVAGQQFYNASRLRLP